MVKFTGFSYSVAVNGMKDEDNLIIFDEDYYVPHFEVMYKRNSVKSFGNKTFVFQTSVK